MQLPKFMTSEHMLASFLMTDISRIIRQAVDLQMRKAGLTRSQWFILHYVYHYEGSTQQELADMVDMGKSSLAKQLYTLELNKWVYRAQNASDGRSFRVFLTEEMRKMITQINELAVFTLSPVLGRLKKEEISVLLKILHTLDSHLEDDLKSPDVLRQADQMAHDISKKLALAGLSPE